MKIFQRFMSGDSNTRALQLSGMVRFACVFLQGVVLVKLGVSHELIGLIEMLFFLSEFSRYFILNGTKTAAFAWKGNTGGTTRSRLYAIHVFALISVLVLVLSYYIAAGDVGYDIERLFLLAGFTYFMITAEQYDWIFLELQRRFYLLPYSIIVYGLQALIVCLSIYYGTINLMLGLLTLLYFIRTFHLHRLLKNEKYSRAIMLSFAAVVTPIAAQTVVNGIMPFIDLWVVEYRFDDATFLYFKYGARQFPVFMILLAGLRQGLLAGLKHKSLEEKALAIRKEIKTHTLIIFLPAILLMLISPLLYPLVYDGDFLISAFIFNTYLLILIFHVFIIQVFFFLENKEWVLFRFSIAEALLNLILSILLSQMYGLFGIVWATVIANVFMKALQFVWIRRNLALEMRDLLPIKRYALYSLGLIIAFCASIYIYG